jgi:signal peptidase I
MGFLLTIVDFFASIPKYFRLRRAKKIFFEGKSLFDRKKKGLSTSDQETIERICTDLKTALKKKNANQAVPLSKELSTLKKSLLKKSLFERCWDFSLGLAFALFIAILIRQSWFEIYRIPTGSMRPTLKEKDFLVASKTNYGINYPLKTKHLYFDDALLKRGDIVIFSGDQMDIADVDTRYFYLFPGKKQFVKRLIGKGGDTLYFYGGLIYGIDKEGHPIEDLDNSSIFQTHEHIPFIKFEEKVRYQPKGHYQTALFYQMNQPIAKLESGPHGGIEGKMLNTNIKEYSDLWGFKNYAMVKIMPKHLVPKSEQVLDAPYYLQLKHHPSVNPPSFGHDQYLNWRPKLSYSVSYLPVMKDHIQKIKNSLTTARFQVDDNKAFRYGISAWQAKRYAHFPTLPISNGTYEFDQGKAYKELILGQLKQLPSTHPIYQDEHIVNLYNMGIEFDTHFDTTSPLEPSRYAYFRDGDLYLMGQAIYQKNDPALIAFHNHEKQKAATSSHKRFQDYGAPLNNDGSINVAFIQKYGIKIPEKSYMVLGDNHAMSGDSRVFGFVPEANIKGRVGFVFWPFSNNMAFPMQPKHNPFHLPTIVIWTLFLTFLTLYILWLKKKRRDQLSE